MQIVIEIPDIVKTRCDGGGILQTIDIIKLKNAVAHGTPLPEHHGRLIDTDVLVDGFEDNYEFCEAVNATPTIVSATKEDTIGKFVDALFFGESATKEGDRE